MALFPVQGIFEHDFVVVLVPIDDEDPMTLVAEKIAHHTVGRRVAPQPRPMQVRHQGNTLAPDATVVSAGVAPMDVLQVSYT
ncbi:MAG: toluene monooxygenase system protein [Actinomycetota bacterium]|jgi:toluene monooxygenase system protein B|nr:toluene monooxygenase system protein [Actinomycetota bacterium]